MGCDSSADYIYGVHRVDSVIISLTGTIATAPGRLCRLKNKGFSAIWRI